MAWYHIKCPHCGHANGPVSINEKSPRLVNTRYCINCHERYVTEVHYGEISVMKK